MAVGRMDTPFTPTPSPGPGSPKAPSAHFLVPLLVGWTDFPQSQLVTAASTDMRASQAFVPVGAVRVSLLVPLVGMLRWEYGPLVLILAWLWMAPGLSWA